MKKSLLLLLSSCNAKGGHADFTQKVLPAPDGIESAETVKSCFMTLEESEASSMDGLFAYYFLPEIDASFREFIRE